LICWVRPDEPYFISPVMIGKSNLTIRSATQEDERVLSHLVHFESYIHRHLDYRPPLDWMGSNPFLVMERNGKVEAALICPPDPPKVAWIRLFAASQQLKPQKAWELMWEQGRMELTQIPRVTWAVAIPLQNWFRTLLERSQFKINHYIVMMKWEKQSIKNGNIPAWLSMRLMTENDLPAIQCVDEMAFVPVWQNSLITLQIAFQQAGIATVAEVDNQIVGYQISTLTHMGGHLARLAVLPEYQKRGIGRALLLDMLNQYYQRGAQIVTVNTQKDNLSSLSLYQKAGFKFSGEEYPIYQYDIN
jgi:[ribosomal protein S18]-alanine N-acetyltransferase